MNENTEAAALAPSEPDPHGPEAMEVVRAEMQARAAQRERARVAVLPILNRLSNELALFLARAEQSGYGAGMREQWGKVHWLVILATNVVREFLPLSNGQQAKWKDTGVLTDLPSELVPGFRLLDETLRDLTFAVLQNEAGAWAERIPVAKRDSLRVLLRVVDAQRTSLESGPMIEGFEWPAPPSPSPAPMDCDDASPPPLREQLDDTERCVRDALRHARTRDEGLKARTLANRSSVSEDAINRAVKRLRGKGYTILRGRGASGYRLIDEPADG